MKHRTFVTRATSITHVCLMHFLFILCLGCQSSPSELEVLAFGDSGSCNSPSDPSSCLQNAVARSMKAVCDADGCDMGIMLGDNIYETGVTSERDDQFYYKYEYHYAPLGIPMYPAIGNHDIWGANTSEEIQIQAQINYSKYSKSWKMLDEYYDFTQAGVHFFVLNTSHFNAKQQRWLANGLKTSQARWKVVYGHYPIHSNGSHGDTIHLVDKLLPIVCAHADMYVSAHDHDLQLLDADCGIPLVISGAAGKQRESNTSPDAPRRRWSVSSMQGFARLVFTDKTVKVIYYDGEGKQLYARAYNRLYRIQQRDNTQTISDNNSLYVKSNHTPLIKQNVGITTFTAAHGTHWKNAIWELERHKKFNRIKNYLTGEYLYINKHTLKTAPQNAKSPKGKDILKRRAAQWQLVTPQTGIMYIQNRYTKEYLSIDANNQLTFTTTANDIESNWILSPVDWDSDQ